VDHELVRNVPQAIQAAVRRFLQGPALCLVTIGGTGAGRRDLTIETVAPCVEKELPGFGELFRRLSHEEIGNAAMLSRALCGVSRGKVICCLPGSEAAVRLALSRLLLPELPHLVWVASR
jgi:molybdenum cofactor biosynthesis protein B